MAPKPFFEFPQARRLRPPNPPLILRPGIHALFDSDQLMRNLNPRVWVRQITVSFNVLPLYAYPNPLTTQPFPPLTPPAFFTFWLAARALTLPAGAEMLGFRGRHPQVIRRPAPASPARRRSAATRSVSVQRQPCFRHRAARFSGLWAEPRPASEPRASASWARASRRRTQARACPAWRHLRPCDGGQRQAARESRPSSSARQAPAKAQHQSAP